MTDVLVGVPVAQMNVKGGSEALTPSPEELCKLYYAEIQTLKADGRRRDEMLQVTSSVALGMLKLLADMGYTTETNEITIPLAVHLYMDGASIEVARNDAGDITVRLIERERS